MYTEIFTLYTIALMDLLSSDGGSDPNPTGNRFNLWPSPILNSKRAKSQASVSGCLTRTRSPYRRLNQWCEPIADRRVVDLSHPSLGARTRDRSLTFQDVKCPVSVPTCASARGSRSCCRTHPLAVPHAACPAHCFVQPSPRAGSREERSSQSRLAPGITWGKTLCDCEGERTWRIRAATAEGRAFVGVFYYSH